MTLSLLNVIEVFLFETLSNLLFTELAPADWKVDIFSFSVTPPLLQTVCSLGVCVCVCVCVCVYSDSSLLVYDIL
jgi:hypothetical protein